MFRKIVGVVFLMLVLVIPNVMVSLVRAQTTDFPPLTEPGPYGVRLKILTFVDKSRGDWKLETGIWYPADKTKGTPVATGSLLLKDSPPDKTGAPYPLIVYSHGWMSSFGELMDVNVQLASQGYVVVAPTHHDTNPPTHELVDRPLDIEFVLNELDAIKEGDLAGMIDMENVGMMGYSQGAETSLQMLGLLSDPVAYTAWCKQHPDIKTFDCSFINIEKTESYRTQLGLTKLPNGRWTPFGDKRIHAALVMAPGDFPLTTDDMLASVTIPFMILHGSKDEGNNYEGNALNIYTHIGSNDRYLITVVDGTHEVFTTKELSQHFATAFFGYYLKADKTYLPYLTPEHLPERLPSWSPFKLVWGPYVNK